jgi:hypothetical protein
MKIYNYHSEYKHFTGISVADESPLEPGVFHIPAYATEIEPPNCELNQIQIFNGTSWNILKDQRGTYYDISFGISQENYNPLEAPENATKEIPPEVLEGKILKWNSGWILEDIPPPQELTVQEKLQAAGITLDELKAALGL